VKVGDLVTLSSYGKKIKRTGWIRDGDVGIIKEVRGAYFCGTYKILWCKSVFNHSQKREYATRGNYYYWESYFDRRDLKYAKKKP
tara:strand:+ start:17667 stop:17921 length:255 start_codon:yes stop_codon:yes gene_type:complete